MNHSAPLPSLRNVSLRKAFLMPWAWFFPVAPIVLFCSLGLLYAPPSYQAPEQIPYWNLVFGMPHIVSSFQTTCDREYWSAYGFRALCVLGLMLMPLALYMLGASPKIMLTVNFIWTIYHVIAQQYGIAFGAARVRVSLLSSLCKYSTIALGVIAYMQVSLFHDMDGDLLYRTLTMVTAAITPPLLIVMTIMGVTLLWRIRTNAIGASLLGLNLLLFLLALVLIFKTPYALIGLMVVRILHDVTGFIAYIRHDTIRNRGTRPNVLYRLFPFLPVWLLNPLLAVIIAAVLTRGAQDMLVLWWLMIDLNIAHYYMESFIWKQGTPHRRHFIGA
ncbi:hypothetical protein [Burkholderia singularis]|nr:hypothetical protein [Burkholderia singularis]